MDVSLKAAMKSRTTVLAGTFSAILLTPTFLYSATQGVLGKTSSASMSITLTIPPRLTSNIVTELPVNDLAVPAFATANDSVPLCVSSNGLPSYTVTASGYSETGDFALQNGQGQLPYDVFLWNSTDNNPQQLTHGVASAPMAPLLRGQKCDGTSRLALYTQQPIDPNLPVSGAVNLTISAD